MSQNDALLKTIDAGKASPVYLLTGEEFLVRRASDEIVARLLPKAMAGLNLSVLDGASAGDVARDLSTAPMFRGRKLVVVREPEFLAPRKGRADALSRIKEAWLSGRRRVAANRALSLLSRAGLGPKDLASPDPQVFAEELEIELAPADVAFLKDLGAFCEQERLLAPEGDTGALEALLERGLPAGHHLVLEATHLDARLSLAKLCLKVGTLVERKVERELRKLEIGETVQDALRPFKKRLEPSAEKRLKELCGGNMRLLQSELEKLALYAGERPVITADDVALLVQRVREEEFRELSDALGARDARAALRYVEVALEQDEPPLKIHGAIASIVRNLLEDRERWGRMGLSSRTPKGEFDGRGFKALAEDVAARGGRAPHPFVAWIRFQACMRFGVPELVRAHLAVASADLRLKSGGQGRLVLSSLVFTLCQPSA